MTLPVHDVRDGARGVTVICDLVEEDWPSMQFVAEATIESLNGHGGQFLPSRFCPAMARRFSNANTGTGYRLDRVLNRFWDYPKTLRKMDRSAGLYHVIDHSYAQLVHELPASRTVVTCHDADTFRSLTHPAEEPRSALFRLMTRRTLSGLQRAARVCCDSDTTRRSLTRHKLVAADRMRTVLLPVHPDFSPCSNAAAEIVANRLLGECPSLDLLHVGSTVQRKRIDVLLAILAKLKLRLPSIRLLRAGGAFTVEQEVLIDRLGVRRHILCLPALDRPVLAAVYRRAALVVLTSEREGFGLPLVEAIASGTPVVVTDLPITREVGSGAASYSRLGDVDAWVCQIVALLAERDARPASWERRRQAGLARARYFSYTSYANRLASVYSELP